MCERCGYGFEAGEFILEIDGCYYHQDCAGEEFGLQVPEPPEVPAYDEDAAYDKWKEDRALEEWEAENGML